MENEKRISVNSTLLSVLLIIIMVAIAYGVTKLTGDKEKTGRETQERRIIEMEFQMKLYQYNQIFCKKKNWSETLKQIDSMIVLEEQKHLDKK